MSVLKLRRHLEYLTLSSCLGQVRGDQVAAGNKTPERRRWRPSESSDSCQLRCLWSTQTRSTNWKNESRENVLYRILWYGPLVTIHKEFGKKRERQIKTGGVLNSNLEKSMNADVIDGRILIIMVPTSPNFDVEGQSEMELPLRRMVVSFLRKLNPTSFFLLVSYILFAYICYSSVTKSTDSYQRRHSVPLTRVKGEDLNKSRISLIKVNVDT